MTSVNLPKYSVLMTVYKNDTPEWLKIAIESMLNQSEAPSEFLIVQDGPVPTKLINVINEYTENNKDLFVLLINEKNEGLGAALNRGVRHCKYEYIARMDSDDISDVKRCEKILHYMSEHQELSLVGCDCVEFLNTTDNIKGYVRLPQDPDKVKAFAKKRVPIRHPSIIFKKKDVLKVGNYYAIRRSQEYDLVVRMLMAGLKISNVQEVLFYIRVNENFYSRRGGWDKAKLLANQRKEFYRYGFYTFPEFCLYAGINIGMCMMPNRVRVFLYRKFLRKTK